MKKERRRKKGGRGGNTTATGKKPGKQQKTIVFPIDGPDLEDDFSTMAGPNRWCNWAIRDHLLVGSYPKNHLLVEDLLNEGITVFVCLMQDKELERQGTLYIEKAKRVLSENTEKFTQKPEDIQYIHFPIHDEGVGEDDGVLELVDKIIGLVEYGNKVYMHCRGGHGRAGTILSLIFAKVYSLSAWEALELCQKVHDSRVSVAETPGKYKSPETHDQKSQVYRLVAGFQQ